MITASVKITSKGQITIPKKIRDKLKTNKVYFEVINDIVIVKPVKDAAGSLSEFAKNVKPGAPVRKLKEKAWEKAVRKKTAKKSP